MITFIIKYIITERDGLFENKNSCGFPRLQFLQRRFKILFLRNLFDRYNSDKNIVDSIILSKIRVGILCGYYFWFRK